MSRLLLAQYRRDVHDLVRYGGSKNEQSIRAAFQILLDRMAREQNMRLVPELAYATNLNTTVYPDGTIKDSLRLSHGYWEAKDEYDTLQFEIEAKFARGYPAENIIFEDSQRAVLYQNGSRIKEASMEDEEQLGTLLEQFFAFERPEVLAFRRAVRQFALDLPDVLATLRDLITTQYGKNRSFARKIDALLETSRTAINPALEFADMREMLIQHILTEQLFLAVFSESQYHRENNIARELNAVEESFFSGAVKRSTVDRLQPYYAAIRRAAANTSDFGEKQNFLKAVYENFYRIYNPKAAEKLGVVYTPSEIVNFMVRSTETLLNRQFGKLLQDKNVDILDPATGTGTFITSVLDHLRAQPKQLKYKYEKEIHCNEVAILPYYIANLNIEYTYARIMNAYEEFPNICFVDTLDNLGFVSTRAGQQTLDFGISAENITRIKSQNNRRISIIIGNPPYYANQKNENENNKSRAYPDIDASIRATYVARSAATKTKAYDMYVRFFRWASNRIDKNGIIAFITNRSFINGRNLDGFRKVVAEEFSDVYILDLGGDVRTNPRLSGPKHNVFGIQTGVAISFMVRRDDATTSNIFYARLPEDELAVDKLRWLAQTDFKDIDFEHLVPDDAGNWIGTEATGFKQFIPLASKTVKATRVAAAEHAVFKLYSLGVSTNRDEWVYDNDKSNLLKKMRAFARVYGESMKTGDIEDQRIKWSRNLKRRLKQGRKETIVPQRIISSSYRPFTKRWLYDSDLFIDEGGSKDEMFPTGVSNIAICFSDAGSRTAYCVLAVDGIADLHFGSSVDAYQQVPRYRFNANKERIDNISDWALERFREFYAADGVPAREITKDDIFAYTYAVLQDPIYRKAYETDLRREFPRIPFYPDLWKWVFWGQQLLDLHLHYEDIEPARLRRVELAKPKAKRIGNAPMVLKADQRSGTIVIDERTSLVGVPDEAWAFRLGSRSALGWVLDQAKKAAKARAARFASLAENERAREEVILLIRKVATVSIRTQAIIAEMAQAARSDGELQAPLPSDE